MTLQWLRTEGRYIKNEVGQIQFLRGVAIRLMYSGWMIIDNEATFEVVFKDTLANTINRIHDVGAKIIKLHVDAQSWLNLAAYRDLVSRLVQFATQNDIYVDICCSSLDGRWTPENKAAMIMGTDSAAQTRWLNFWSSIATAFQGNPTVLYSLINEPQRYMFSVDTIAPVWANLTLQCIDVIRAIESRVLILVSSFWTGEKQLYYFNSNPIPRANIVYVWHNYYSNDLYISGRKYQYALDYNAGNLLRAKQELRNFIDNAIFHYINAGLPVMAEECGCEQWFRESGTGDLYEVNNWNIEMQDRYDFYWHHGISWIQWHWRPFEGKGNFSILTYTGTELNDFGKLMKNNMQDFNMVAILGPSTTALFLLAIGYLTG